MRDFGLMHLLQSKHGHEIPEPVEAGGNVERGLRLLGILSVFRHGPVVGSGCKCRCGLPDLNLGFDGRRGWRRQLDLWDGHWIGLWRNRQGLGHNCHHRRFMHK
jgi:hypothetical protein